MKHSLNIIFAFVILICCVVAAFYCLYHGVVNGIIEKQIIGDYHGNYLTGKNAIVRGIFFIIIGLINVSGAIITCFFLYKHF